MGITHNESSVYDKFKADIKLNGDHYEVSLPFKEDHPPLG